MANKLSRRKVLSTFGLTGLGMLASTANASVNSLVPVMKEGEVLLVFSTIAVLMESTSLKLGNFVQTAGYYQVGDSGHGTYLIKEAQPNQAVDN